MAETKAEQLKKCPFCGGEAMIEYDSQGDALSMDMYTGQCQECFSESTVCDTKAEAITAWNTRAEDALAGAMEKIEKLASRAMTANEIKRGLILNEIGMIAERVSEDAK